MYRYLITTLAISALLIVWTGTHAAKPSFGTEFCGYRDIFPELSKDSVIHSPKKAAILSALLPGAGQAYNRKYLKIPVIYAGGAAGAYFIHTNLKEFKRFRTAYIYRNDDDPNTIDDFPQASSQQLKVYRDYYRRNTELSVIITSALYLVQILDATVDAHLFDFDVSNNLSVHCQPVLLPRQNSPAPCALGLSLALNFGGAGDTGHSRGECTYTAKRCCFSMPVCTKTCNPKFP